MLTQRLAAATAQAKEAEAQAAQVRGLGGPRCYCVTWTPLACNSAHATPDCVVRSVALTVCCILPPECMVHPAPLRGSPLQLRKDVAAGAAENKELLTICNQLLSQVEKNGGKQ